MKKRRRREGTAAQGRACTKTWGWESPGSCGRGWGHVSQGEVEEPDLMGLDVGASPLALDMGYHYSDKMAE